MDWTSPTDGGVLIRVRVTPRAKKDAVGTPKDGQLPVRTTAPPVDSKANKAVIALLAKALGIPKSALSIKSGEKSRNKTVLVKGLQTTEVKTRLQK